MSSKELIQEAIRKLEEAQEQIRIEIEEDKPLQFLVMSQRHYEVSKAKSELEYTLSTM